MLEIYKEKDRKLKTENWDMVSIKTLPAVRLIFPLIFFSSIVRNDALI